MDEVTLGGSQQMVQLRLVGREFPDAEGDEDGQWLIAEIRVRAHAMSADIRHAALRIDELQLFADQLGAIYRTLSGVAHLQSLEEWIDLRIEANANGTLAVDGQVLDQPGIGNELRFSLAGMDQTHLPSLVADLQDALSRYPATERR